MISELWRSRKVSRKDIFPPSTTQQPPRGIPYPNSIRNKVWLACMLASYGEIDTKWNIVECMYDYYIGPHYLHSRYFGG